MVAITKKLKYGNNVVQNVVYKGQVVKKFNYKGNLVFSKVFNVYLSKGTNVDSVYSSTNVNATSGSSTGAEYEEGNTVYAFAKLTIQVDDNYDKPSNWVYVGEIAPTYRCYRYGSCTDEATLSSGSPTAIPSYTISVSAGSNVSSVYLATTSTTQTGNASGTYRRGTTVYAFAKITNATYTGYQIPSSWVYITTSGTDRIYRVGSVVVSDNYSFGAISLTTKKQFTLTITTDSTISQYYVNNTRYTTSKTLTFDYGTSVVVANPSGSGTYFIPTTLSKTITMDSNKSMTIKAVAQKTTQVARSGDRTSYKSVLSITAQTYIQKVDIINSTNTARTCYVGTGTSSTSTPTRFITNGGNAPKNSTTSFTSTGIDDPIKYLVWKLDSGTWTIANVSIKVYYYTGWTFA